MKTPTNIPSTLCFRASPFIACLWKLTQQQVWKSVSVSPSLQKDQIQLSLLCRTRFPPFLFAPKDFWRICCISLPDLMNNNFASYIYNPDFTIWYFHWFVCCTIIYHPNLIILYLHWLAVQFFIIQILSISFCFNPLRAFNHCNQKLYARH